MRTTTSVTAFVVAVLTVLGATAAPATAAPSDGSTHPGSTRVTAKTPTGVSLVPIDSRTYQVTGRPRCGALESTCQVHVGDVGGDYHWDGGTSTATFAGWPYGETRTPTFWTYACIGVWCGNSAKVSGTPVTRPWPKQPITAQLRNQDDGSRTAVFTGTASRKADIRWNGRTVAVASDAATGSWQAVLPGLQPGRNDVTFQQYVDGGYRDQTTVSVTFPDAVAKDQIVGEAGTADLARGTESDVSVTYQAKSAFSSPTGTLTLTAPTGTTFAPGQDQQPGEYEQGGTWTAFGGNSIIGGERSADGTQYRYQLANRDWGVAKDQRFRFTMRVVTPADVAPTTGELTGALKGSFTNATFDTTARTTTTVVDRALGAEVRDADVLAGTATLVGTAPARADSVEVTWQRDGQTVTRRAPATDGAWTLRLDGLALGETSVRLVATDGGAAVGDPVTVAVRLVAAELTAEVRFDDDVTKPVTVTGHGQPGASIRFDGVWTAVPAVTVPSSGDWSVTIPAPGAGGTHPLTVVQTVRQQQAGSVQLRVDYGPGVDIRSPGDGFGITPIWNTVRVSGVAAPGARVRLGEGGDDDAYGTVTADASGRWAITTTPLEIREHVLVATALSKGANTTTDSVRITG